MNGGNVKIIAISEIYEASVSVYFVSESKITQPPTVIMAQVMTEITISV
jgi:hypothetical protein